MLNPPLAVKWKVKLQEKSEDQEYNELTYFNPPVIYDDTLYFGSRDGNFYALDIASGFMKWIFRSDYPINSVPTVDDGQVYFGSTDRSFYALDRRTGEINWSFDTGNEVNSSVALYDGGVSFTSDTGAVYLFSTDGQYLFEIENRSFSHHTFQIKDGIVYFALGSESGNPYAFGVYSIGKRRFLWDIDISKNPGLVWYSYPAVKGGVLHYSETFFSINDRDPQRYIFYGLDQKTGKPLWIYEEYTANNEFYKLNWREHIERLDLAAPALWRDTVVYSVGNNFVYAFNAKTGQIRWKKNLNTTRNSLTAATCSPVVIGNNVYFGVKKSFDRGISDGEYALYALNMINGDVAWSFPVEGEIASSPVSAGKWIVFGTSHDYFYVLEEVL